MREDKDLEKKFEDFVKKQDEIVPSELVLTDDEDFECDCGLCKLQGQEGEMCMIWTVSYKVMDDTYTKLFQDYAEAQRFCDMIGKLYPGQIVTPCRKHS